MTSTSPTTFAAEKLLARLKANGTDHLFATGGSDFAPIVECLANGMAKQMAMPVPIIAPHETAALGNLAAEFALPVVEFWPTRNVLPTRHPMQSGYDVMPWLAGADVVLVLDSPAPWVQRFVQPRADAKVIHVGPDPLFSRWPMRSFPIALAITASAVAAVSALSEELLSLGAGNTERYKKIEANNHVRREGLSKKALTGNSSLMTPAYVAHCLSQAMDENAVLFNELGVPIEFTDLAGPNRCFNMPLSGGLGWGMPAALGASLADRDRLVIACMGDGSYIFANPVACHHIAEAHGLPVLFVVMNNGMWNSVRRATLSMYPKGQAAGMDVMPITSLEPSPDYAQVVKASRGWSETVENAADLPGAIARAIAVIKTEKRQAVLNVIIAATA